jgi:hypothetical protein
MLERGAQRIGGGRRAGPARREQGTGGGGGASRPEQEPKVLTVPPGVKNSKGEPVTTVTIPPDQVWHQSTRFESNKFGQPNVVEVAFVPLDEKTQVIVVRDGTQPNGPTLVYTTTEWDAFVDGAKAGEFDLTKPDPIFGQFANLPSQPRGTAYGRGTVYGSY